MPHLEALKEELFGQHHSEDVCPAQGGSAGALEPPGLFAWAGRLRSRSYWELLVPMFSSSPVVPAWAHLKHFDLSGIRITVIKCKPARGHVQILLA